VLENKSFTRKPTDPSFTDAYVLDPRGRYHAAV
jgi:hypothetical protein